MVRGRSGMDTRPSEARAAGPDEAGRVCFNATVEDANLALLHYVRSVTVTPSSAPSTSSQRSSARSCHRQAAVEESRC